MTTTYQKVKHAVIAVNNSEDASRKYDISADVNVHHNDQVGRLNGGIVRPLGDSEGVITTFFTWDDVITYGAMDSNCDHADVVTAIQAFVASVKSKVAEGGLVEL